MNNGPLDHSGCDFSGVDFVEFPGVMWNDAILTGVNLEGATLLGGTLYGADLSNANLRGTSFIESVMGFTNFDGADLTGAHVFLGTRAPEFSDEPRPTHCSAFVARCFRLSGQPLFELVDNLASPDDISKSLAFVPQGTLDLQNRKATLPPPPPPLATRIKLMSLELVEKASALLPDALRRGVSSALETEALVREGQATLARNEGEGSRYESVLRGAIDDVVKARLEALRAVDAFRRGDLGLAQALTRVQQWNDAGAKVLWQKLEAIDGDAEAAAEE
jgi:hypothetical protein